MWLESNSAFTIVWCIGDFSGTIYMQTHALDSRGLGIDHS